MSDKTLILLFPGERLETFEPKEAAYWIRRRLSKEGIQPLNAWLAEPFDFTTIISDYYAEQCARETEAKELQDRSEYERLKIKFEEKK